jgi:hypothetical protein
VTRGLTKLYNELHNFYSSTRVIKVSKSRWMRWLSYAAGMGEKEIAYWVLVGKPEETVWKT